MSEDKTRRGHHLLVNQSGDRRLSSDFLVVLSLMSLLHPSFTVSPWRSLSNMLCDWCLYCNCGAVSLSPSCRHSGACWEMNRPSEYLKIVEKVEKETLEVLSSSAWRSLRVTRLAFPLRWFWAVDPNGSSTGSSGPKVALT